MKAKVAFYLGVALVLLLTGSVRYTLVHGLIALLIALGTRRGRQLIPD